MRFHIIPLVLAASITGATAMPQFSDITSLSSCAQSSLLNLLTAVECALSPNETQCVCGQAGLLATVYSTVNGKCGSSDAQAAVAAAQSQCAAAGITLAAAPQTPSTTVVGSMTLTSTLTPASPTASTSSMPAFVGSTMPTMAPAGNSTWNGTMISPSPFRGAADSVNMGDIAACLLGVAVAFAML